MVDLVIKLQQVAIEQGLTLAQLTLLWAMQNKVVCSTLIGASQPEQLVTNCQVLRQKPLNKDVLTRFTSLLQAYHGRPVSADGQEGQ